MSKERPGSAGGCGDAEEVAYDIESEMCVCNPVFIIPLLERRRAFNMTISRPQTKWSIPEGRPCLLASPLTAQQGKEE